MKFDAEKAKQQLLRRTQEAIKNKDRGQYGSLFTVDVPQWKCDTGGHKIDIIPWVASSNITKFTSSVPPGDYCYVLTIFVHFGIGPNDESVLCLLKTFGEPCPVCEHKKRLQDTDADQADIDEFKWKQRTLYNVLVHDSKDELKKGVQVLDIAHFFLEYHLIELAALDPVTGEPVLFMHPTEGKQVYFKRIGSGMGSKVAGHQFVERDYDIPQKILDQAYILDEIVHIPTYEEVYKKLHGGSAPVPASSGLRNKREDREDIPVELERQPEEEVLPRKRNAAIEPERRRNSVLEEVTTAVSQVCPVGGRFGIDHNQLKKCDTCNLYDACADAASEQGNEQGVEQPERKSKGDDEVLLPQKTSKLKGRK
jgi:hypothetical protein